MKIAFVYNQKYPHFHEKYFSQQHRRFFLKALPTVATIKHIVDPAQSMADCDAAILFGLKPKYLPAWFDGAGLPKRVIACSHDSHAVNADDFRRADRWGVRHMFYHHYKGYFYKYWPESYEYTQIILCVDPDVCRPIIPFVDRVADKVLMTGAITDRYHYELRGELFKSDLIHYVKRHKHFDGDSYNLLLNNFSASVAACTTTTVNKYFESMAAGCLLFAECSNNGCGDIGLVDGENCISINRDNAIEKISAFITDNKNPKWGKIADAGVEHCRKYSMYKQARILLQIIETI